MSEGEDKDETETVENASEKRVWTVDDFRDDEVADVRGGKHPKIDGKLRILNQHYPDLVLLAERAPQLEDEDTIAFRAELLEETVRMKSGEAEGWSTRTVAQAVGTAHREGDAKLSDSLVMLAETRAWARCLRQFGIGVGAASAEEVQGKPPLSERSREPQGQRAQDTEDRETIIVPNGYDHRDSLRDWGFRFDSGEKWWYLKTGDVDRFTEKLDEEGIDYEVEQ